MTPIPVLDVDGMRAWERATWAAGVREDEVIARVGGALAARIRSWHRPGERLLLLCGRGHNGDDVRAAVPHLGDFTIEVLEVRNPAAALDGLREALARRPACVVDGLFGIGLNRPLDADWIRLIGALNGSGLPVLAVDVPSGLDARTGLAQGAAVRAAVTLTVGAPKVGMMAEPAAEFVGRLEVLEDIGLVPWSESVCAPVGWFGSAGEFEGWPPRRAASSHKGDFGHVCLVAGSLGYHGAAVLAARAALRAGPGLVTVVTAPDSHVPVASQLAAAMVRPWEPGAALPGRTTAVVVGPGLADPRLPGELRGWVAEGWRSWPVPVVADASALEWLPRGAAGVGAVRVLTPHPGEAARLLGVPAGEVQVDRVAAARRLSREFGGAWAVLKGRGTVVVSGDGLPWWNPTGNPGLAQGGSGDVLAGFMGGLLAQPALAADAGRAVRGAVYWHGAAADFLASLDDPWSAEDLAGAIRWGRR